MTVPEALFLQPPADDWVCPACGRTPCTAMACDEAQDDGYWPDEIPGPLPWTEVA